MGLLYSIKYGFWKAKKKFNKRFRYNQLLESQATAMRGQSTIEEWENDGCPLPPPAVYKQKVVSTFQNKFKISHLIETGTFYGDMINNTKEIFTTIDSIEIDEKLHKRAKNLFSSFKGITIHLGDSKHILPNLIKNKKDPAIYWLDGHFSGGVTGKGEKTSPIMEELDTIFNNYNQDVILVDDARNFDGEDDYPSFEELTEKIHAFDAEFNIEVNFDIIRIYKGEKIEV